MQVLSFIQYIVSQTLKERLEQLDKQTQAINDHMTKLAGYSPAQEEEVRAASLSGLTGGVRTYVWWVWLT